MISTMPCVPYTEVQECISLRKGLVNEPLETDGAWTQVAGRVNAPRDLLGIPTDPIADFVP